MTVRNLIINGQDHTQICGILNVTPDSFSDGNEATTVELAVEKARRLIDGGASMIDVGGESTRPGFIPVSEADEIERVVPVISALRKEINIPISVDTTKSRVAYESVLAGADMVNDVSGLFADNKMAEIIASLKVYCCLMHDGQYFEKKTDYLSGVCDDLKIIVEKAVKAGIDSSLIMLDPGIGFGKTQEENICLIRNLDKIKALGFPVMLGCSRKSVIGNVLNLTVEEREEGTLATTAMAVNAGVDVVRVHDACGNHRFIKMYETLIKV